MRTIAIVNQKGGCGKTTTAINLAAVCAARGLRTLVVDMDPQSHCAAGLGVPESAIENSIGAALLSNLDKGFDRRSLVWEVSRNLDLAPSTMGLAALEAPGGGLHALPDKDRRLALLLKQLAPHYDRCLIDCPPTIGLLTYNALRAAGEAIIPVETGFFALRGAKRQWETIRNLVERVSHSITCYVLPTLYDENEKIARDILGSMKRQFGGRVIPLVVADRPEIREATGFGQPVIEYAPNTPAVKDFERLADWLEDHPADPPELHVEVKSVVTVPYLKDGEAPPPYVAPDSGFERTDVSSRAAEMALRVRKMSAARNEADAESNTTPPSRATASAVTPRIIIQKPATRHATERESSTPLAERPVVTAVDAAVIAARRRATLVESKDLPPQISLLHTNLVRMFGVRQTNNGALFVQPGAPGMVISVAGSFNHWSATASTLRYNPDAGVYELLLPLSPGRYEYRLVIDGRWQSDPYNTNRVANSFGGENNWFVVEAGHHTTPGDEHVR